MIIKDIEAYHQTTRENGPKILKEGFDEKFFRQVSIGYGVQCLLKKTDHAKYEGKTGGQLRVFFENCKILEDFKQISKSTDRIQEEEVNQQLEVAKEEALRLMGQGVDAYYCGKDIIVFLNYRFLKVIEWIPF